MRFSAARASLEVGLGVTQPAQGGVAVGDDRGERLIDLVGDRSGHRAHRRQTRDPGKLGVLRQLALARLRELGQHLVERDRQASDLVAAVFFDPETIILGFAHRLRHALEALQRPHDMPVHEKRDEDGERAEDAGEKEAAIEPAEKTFDAAVEKPVELGKVSGPGSARAVDGVDIGGAAG